MAYSAGPAVCLKHSTSLMPGNLAVVLGVEGSGSVTYAVAHRSCVDLVHFAAGACKEECANFDQVDKDTSSPLLQVRWCRLQCKSVLVLASYRAFKILEWTGSALCVLHSENLETMKQDDPTERKFARGVGSVGNAVCIGTSDGCVMVYELVPTAEIKAKFLRRLEGHSSPVSDVATNPQGEIASCDESGCIIVWTDPLTSVDSSLVIREENLSPCLALCFWESVLIGGYADGVIRLFSADTGAKMAEITAHARSVLALDVALRKGLLLSVAEDCTANVWKLPTESDPKVDLVFSATVPNALLCGGRFLDPQGNRFALTAYDWYQIITFTKSS